MKKILLLILTLCAETYSFAQEKSALPFSIISLEKAMAEESNDSLEKYVYHLHDVDKDGRPELFVKEKVKHSNTYYAFTIKPNKDVELVAERSSGGVEEFDYTDDGYICHYEEHTGGLTNRTSNFKIKSSRVAISSFLDVDMSGGNESEEFDVSTEYEVMMNGEHFSKKESDYQKFSPKGQRTSLYDVEDWHSFPASEIQKLTEYRNSRPEKKKIYGDLNKDGREDLIVIETPRNKENMIVREDGYAYNFNQPVLYIYFADENYDQKLFKKYDNVIPHPETEDECLDLEVSVTNKGVLKIFYSLFYSMGSYTTTNSTYLYRYQNGDFYLIGEEQYESQRNTGEYHNTSFNYSTKKRQETIGNNFDDKKPTVNWFDLPNDTLHKLGEKNLKTEQ